MTDLFINISRLDDSRYKQFILFWRLSAHIYNEFISPATRDANSK